MIPKGLTRRCLSPEHEGTSSLVFKTYEEHEYASRDDLVVVMAFASTDGHYTTRDLAKITLPPFKTEGIQP